MSFFEMLNNTPQIITPEIITVEAEEVNIYNSLGWEILERPIFNLRGEEIEGYKEIVRNDNYDSLNICKSTYTPVSNYFFCHSVEVLQNISGLVLEGFHEYKNGAIVTAHLWNEEPVKILGHDYNTYLIIGNSHNYQTPFFIGEKNVMLRCKNQFNRFKGSLRAYHTSLNVSNVNRIIQMYSFYKDLQTNTIELFERLERKGITADVKYKMIRHLLEISPSVPFVELSARKKRQVELFTSSINRECMELGENAFGLFNGVTHFTTHIRNAREKEYSLLFGNDNSINTKALNYLVNI